MLKQQFYVFRRHLKIQPPLGGCVLKLGKSRRIKHFYKPAAFRRLCVETVLAPLLPSGKVGQPPLGGCVLKLFDFLYQMGHHHQPPLGGCVLKLPAFDVCLHTLRPAAFRRLCVETIFTPRK